jgi:hypothetical protein
VRGGWEKGAQPFLRPFAMGRAAFSERPLPVQGPRSRLPLSPGPFYSDGEGSQRCVVNNRPKRARSETRGSFEPAANQFLPAAFGNYRYLVMGRGE